MDNVLSQNEVNALLNAVKTGSVPTEADPEEVAVQKKDARGYDLTSNDRIVRGRMPTLDILNQRLARLMRQSLFNMFRKTVEVTHEKTELLKYNEFIETVSVPACLNIFRMPPLKNTCLVAVDAPLMFGLVDHVFGGNGSWYRVEGREYSSIEVKLIEQVVTLVLKDLEGAWEPVLSITCEYLRTEVNPQFAAIAAPTDVTVHIRFIIEIEGNTRGTISLVIPYHVIEPIRRLLSSALQTERSDENSAWRRQIIAVLLGLDVEFKALLGTGHIRLGDLMAMTVGDTIRLNVDSQEPVPCLVEDVQKGTGWPVMSRGKFALELTEAVHVMENAASALARSGGSHD